MVTSKSDRTINYLRQLKGAMGYRIAAMGASFLTLPLTIQFLGQEAFGVWSTLLTVMSWAVFLDLGVGNGLRNKVAGSIARGEINEANYFIGSGYALVGILVLVIWIVVVFGAYFIPWQIIFNTKLIEESALRMAAQLAASFLLLNLWLGLISALLGAVQKTSLIAFGLLISNLLTLAFVFVLSKITTASIIYLTFAYGISLIAANIVLSLFFYKQNPQFSLNIRFDASHLRPLLGVGLQFFIIQLAVLVISATDKLLITQFFGPEYVTSYEIVFKIFSMTIFAYGLISVPLWSAYTEAYEKNDYAWIRRMLRVQVKIFLGFILAILLLVAITPMLIKIWIGRDFIVPTQLIVALAFFAAISIWNNIFAIFVNGIGKIRLQLFAATFAMLINLPLSIFLIKHTSLGVSAIVVGTCCSLIFSAVALPIQVHRNLRLSINLNQT